MQVDASVLADVGLLRKPDLRLNSPHMRATSSLFLVVKRAFSYLANRLLSNLWSARRSSIAPIALWALDVESDLEIAVLGMDSFLWMGWWEGDLQRSVSAQIKR